MVTWVPPFRRPTNIEISSFNHWQTDGFGVFSRKPIYQSKNNSEPYRLRMIKGCCHQDNKNELTGNKACYFEWSPPWHLFVIVSDISSGNIDGMIFWHSILAFYLAFYLTFYSDILFWHSIWHLFWHPIWHPLWHLYWHFLWFYLAYFLPYVLACYLAFYLTFYSGIDRKSVV